MLDDDDSSTSSSEDENVVMNSLIASNEVNSDKFWNDHDGNTKVRSKDAPTAIVDHGHRKKRIRLSLGGKFKAMISSPKQDYLKHQKQTTKSAETSLAKDITQTTTRMATQHCEKSAGVNITSISPKKEAPNATNPKNIPSAKNDARSKIQKTTKPSKNNAKPKTVSAPAPKASATASTKNRPKEIKRRQSPKLPTSSSATRTVESGTTPARRSSIRSIRITPMSSPGLLLLQRSHIREGGTPNSIFTQTMAAAAGYTTEERSKNPHRGSSIQRTVDDMFDSNVMFCGRFPKLVPDDLLRSPLHLKAVTTTTTAVSSQLFSSDPSALITKAATVSTTTALPSTHDSKPKLQPTEDRSVILMKRLKNAFQTNYKKNYSVASSPVNADTSSTASTNRCKRIPQYSDMVPISLSSTYPDEYIQKRLEYVKKVNEREKAIVATQERQEEALQTDPEAEIGGNKNDIPPIPIPPDVPVRDDLRSMTKADEIFGSKEQQERNHPLYLPKNKEFVEHLDERCFRAIDGRYFGLSSNAISDPYFFGPNAPGIVGLNLSTTTGLATASTGGGAGAFGSPLFTMPAQPSSSSASMKITTTTQASIDVTKKQPIAKPVVSIQTVTGQTSR